MWAEVVFGVQTEARALDLSQAATAFIVIMSPRLSPPNTLYLHRTRCPLENFPHIPRTFLWPQSNQHTTFKHHCYPTRLYKTMYCPLGVAHLARWIDYWIQREGPWVRRPSYAMSSASAVCSFNPHSCLYSTDCACCRSFNITSNYPPSRCLLLPCPASSKILLLR